MLVKSEADCRQFTANDGCQIRELIHPKNDGVDPGFSLALAEVRRGARTYRHRLQQSEVYYLLAGVGCVHVDGEEQCVTSGDAIFIPPGKEQWIENKGYETLRFLAVVAPPWSLAADELLE